MSIIIEKYCCTCGIDKEGKSSGENPTTMCSNCILEEANFCVLCRTELPGTDSMTLCYQCLTKVRKLRQFLDN